MRCPYCQQPAFETDQSCRHCQFSLEMADRMFGSPPTLSPGLSDLAGIFSKSQTKKLTGEIRGIQDLCPQLRISVLSTKLPAQAPLPTYMFWIFNRTGICTQLQKGSTNRTILLTLDTESQRAGMMVGYGLEPLIGDRHINAMLEPATHDFRAEKYFDGVMMVLSTAETVLQEIWDSLEKTYGIEMERLQHEEAKRLGISIAEIDGSVSEY